MRLFRPRWRNARRTCFICMDGAAAEGLVRGCSCRGSSGVAHVSCLVRQAQVVAERTFDRWHTCGLCEQKYHGVVSCALGWACWNTYLGRPETDYVRQSAMNELGLGLSDANHHEDALTVREAELSILRRIDASEGVLLGVQQNLADTYGELGQMEKALSMERDVYYGHLKLDGEEHPHTLSAANNYADDLVNLQRYDEAKSLLRKTVPVARRVLGDSDDLMLKLRWSYAEALYLDAGATVDDLREAVTTFEEVERIARQMLGGSHPYTEGIAGALRGARAALRARETPSASA